MINHSVQDNQQMQTGLEKSPCDVPAGDTTQAEPARRGQGRRGFTLIQLVVSLGVLSMMATMLFNAFSGGRSTARRTQCDARLKTVALALDAFRQERGFYPISLRELNKNHYLHEQEALHCPMDDREDGTYADFYAIRSPRDKGDLPILVCPFHEAQGNAGQQVFKGGYTKQFLTRPAKLEAASSARIERPGGDAVTAVAGIALRGGDRIITSQGGSVVIRFADNSTCELGGNADLTVLQSFVASNVGSTLYTVVRQSLGNVMYKVHHGSKFDVATPTATAGALGTEFSIAIPKVGPGTLKVIESRVYVSAQKDYFEVSEGSTVLLAMKARTTDALDPDAMAPVPNATATPVPTPTSKPDGGKDDGGDHDQGGGNDNKN